MKNKKRKKQQEAQKRRQLRRKRAREALEKRRKAMIARRKKELERKRRMLAALARKRKLQQQRKQKAIKARRLAQKRKMQMLQAARRKRQQRQRELRKQRQQRQREKQKQRQQHQREVQKKKQQHQRELQKKRQQQRRERQRQRMLEQRQRQKAAFGGVGGWAGRRFKNNQKHRQQLLQQRQQLRQQQQQKQQQQQQKQQPQQKEEKKWSAWQKWIDYDSSDDSSDEMPEDISKIDYSAPTLGFHETTNEYQKPPTSEVKSAPSSGASVVSVGKHVWIIDKQGNAHMSKDKGKTWEQKSEGLELVDISTACDGTTLAVSSDTTTYFYAHKKNAFVKVNGCNFKNIAVGRRNIIFGVDPRGRMYRKHGRKWKHLPGNFSKVFAGRDGSVWAIDRHQNAYKLRNNRWRRVAGLFEALAVLDTQNVWGVTVIGTVYRWNGSAWDEMETSSALDSISLSERQGMYGVTEGGKLLTAPFSDKPEKLSDRSGLKTGDVIALQSTLTDKRLQVLDNGKRLEALGEEDDLKTTTFVVKRINANVVQFKVGGTKKNYLRIDGKKKLNALKCAGGCWTHFHVLSHKDGTISLRSVKWSSKNLFVGVLADGTTKDPVRTGTDEDERWKIIQLDKQELKENDITGLKNNDKVFIHSVISGKNLRITKKLQVNARGGVGKLAKFTVEKKEVPNVIVLKLTASGEYLRFKDSTIEGSKQYDPFCDIKVISNSNGTFSLASKSDNNNTIASKPNGKVYNYGGSGADGQWKIVVTD